MHKPFFCNGGLVIACKGFSGCKTYCDSFFNCNRFVQQHLGGHLRIYRLNITENAPRNHFLRFAALNQQIDPTMETGADFGVEYQVALKIQKK